MQAPPPGTNQSPTQLVNVTTPGALALLNEYLTAAGTKWGVEGPDNNRVTKIKITGTLNADDLAAMNGGNWANFEEVDLTGAQFDDDATLSDMDSDGKYFALPSSVTEITAESFGHCPNLVSACAVSSDGKNYVGFTNTPNQLYKANDVYGRSNMNSVEKATISGLIGCSDIAQGKVQDYLSGASDLGTYTPTEDEYYTSLIPDPAIPAFEYGNNGGPNSLKTMDLSNATMRDDRELRQLAGYQLSLVECVLPQNLQSIPPQCFFQSYTLSKVDIPSSVKSIGAYAFYQTPITSVTVGVGIEHIGIAAFGDCNQLYDIHFEDGITSLDFDGYTFASCDGLKQLRLPEGVTNIGDHMFDQCKVLHSLRIPSTCVEIGEGSFKECIDLKLLYIPENVQLIGRDAFSLAGIEDLYLEATDVMKLPKIYSMGPSHLNQRIGASFDTKSMEANNTSPTPANFSGKSSDNGDEGFNSITQQATSYNPKNALEMEEAYRTALGNNILCMLHYSEELREFIDYNPWYREYPDAVNEKPLLSDTYLFEDNEGNLWPTMETNLWRNWLTVPNNSPDSYTRGDGSNMSDYTRCLNAGDPLHEINDRDPWIGTENVDPAKSLIGISYNPETGGEPSRVGWRQFVIKMGSASDPKKTITKEFDDTWYTFCFPYDLTNEQLNTAFNAMFNIVEFNGAELVNSGTNKLGEPKYQLIFHFEEPHAAVYTYTDPETGHLYNYERVVGEGGIISFNPIDGGPTGVLRDDMESYLATAFRPYMIHPNLGVAAGDTKKRCAFINLIGEPNAHVSCEDEDRVYVQETNEVTAPNGETVKGTYTFVGNVDYYKAPKGQEMAFAADMAEKPQFSFNEPEPYNSFNEPEPQIEDYAQGEAPTEPTNPEITTVPTPVADPETNTDYTTDFKALYNTVRCENVYLGYIDGANRYGNFTYGEDLNNYEIGEFLSYHDWESGYAINTQSQGHNTNCDDSALKSYLGITTNVWYEADGAPDGFYTLQNLTRAYKSDQSAYAAYQVDYQAYLDSKAEWDAYREALDRYNSWTSESAQEQYEADHAKWVIDRDAAQAAYQQAYQIWVSNSATALLNYQIALAAWEEDMSKYRPLIPYNTYFLAVPQGGKYPKYYREASKDMTRTSGYWSQYSAIIKSDGVVENKLFGIDDVEVANTQGFEFVIGEYTPTTDDIKDILEDAKKNNLPINYMDIVYDINGQMISPNNSNDLRNLPKGIYIVNGKKYLVK